MYENSETLTNTRYPIATLGETKIGQWEIISVDEIALRCGKRGGWCFFFIKIM